jgi:hypothetical protein
MKKILIIILIKISRLIYFIIPEEFKKKKKKLKSKIDNNLVEETFNHFKNDFKNSVLYEDVGSAREYAIKKSLENDKGNNYYYLEFGVFTGGSTNQFSKHVKKLYAFDSFEGLSEDWSGITYHSKGAYTLNKKIPKLNANVELVVGEVKDTLEDFLKKHNPKINFVNMDMDTYGPTKFALEKLKPYLVKNAIIIFDELYNYIGWENGEYKALKEVFKESEFEYKAFNLSGKLCVVQLNLQNI